MIDIDSPFHFTFEGKYRETDDKFTNRWINNSGDVISEYLHTGECYFTFKKLITRRTFKNFDKAVEFLEKGKYANYRKEETDE